MIASLVDSIRQCHERTRCSVLTSRRLYSTLTSCYSAS